jgi:hypothetical protein
MPPFTPAAVPAYTDTSVGGNAAAAVANAPQEIASNEATTEQAKAATATAKTQESSAANTADDQTLQRLTPMLTGPQGAQIFNSPAMKGILQPILQRRGITDYPTDYQHLEQLVSSASSTLKPVSNYDNDDIGKALALPPEARNLGTDDGTPLYKYLKSAPVRTPMSPTTIQQSFTQLQKQEDLLSDPKSGYTPQMYLADVKSAQARFRASGNSGEADALNENLTPDGSQLNDAFISRHVSDQYNLEKQKLDALGVHMNDEDSYREEREKDLRGQFTQTLAWKKSDLSVREQHQYTMDQNAQTRIQDSERRLNAYMTSTDLNQKRYAASGQRQDFDLYKGVVDKANGELSDARKSLTSVTGQINQMAQNPNLRNSPLYQSLVDQASGLQNFIETQGPVLQQRSTDATQQMNNIIGSVTGNKVTPPPNEGAAKQYYMNGRPIRYNQTKSDWEFFDGSPATVVAK